MYIEQFTQKDQMRYTSIDASEKTIFAGKMSPHWHEFYELELIIDGSGIYNIDGIDYNICPGALFFMSPVSFHKTHFTSDTRLFNIMFRPELCDAGLLFRLFSERPHIAFPAPEETEHFLQILFRELILHLEQEEYAETLLNCVFQKILQCEETKKNLPVLPIQKALLHIQNHFKHPLTLAEVSAVAGLSPGYFSEQFRKYTDTTFLGYLNRLRFSYAEKLLLYTTLSVTEICFECGFNDYSHFLYTFRKHYGTTPVQFRKKKRRKHKIHLLF